MISSLTGTLTDIETTSLTLDVNGVGYLVYCPTRLLNQFQQSIDQKTTIYIYTHVREDQITLYGFTNKSDRHLFKQLITVSGIGPKIALATLSHATGNETIEAITTARVDFFTKIPGIGKKAAQKIIVELKNKLGSLAELDLSEDATLSTHSELVAALTSLGYSSKEATDAAKQIPDELTDLQQQLKFALKNLNN